MVFLKKRLNKFLYNTIILSTCLFLIEIIFKLVSNQTIFDIASIRILFSSIFISMIISYIELFIKDKLIPKINIIIVFIISIYSILQVGFNNFIGVYISFNVSSQAGAVLSYIFDFFKSFYWYYYFLLFPFILLIIYYELIHKRKIKISLLKNNKTKATFALISFLVVFGFLYYVTISLDVFQNEFQTYEKY